MSEDTLSKEERILKMVKRVLTDVAKDIIRKQLAAFAKFIVRVKA